MRTWPRSVALHGFHSSGIVHLCLAPWPTPRRAVRGHHSAHSQAAWKGASHLPFAPFVPPFSMQAGMSDASQLAGSVVDGDGDAIMADGVEGESEGLQWRLVREVARLTSADVQEMTELQIHELRTRRDDAQRRLLQGDLESPPPFESFSAPLLVAIAPNSAAGDDFPMGWGQRVLERASASKKVWNMKEGETKRSNSSSAPADGLGVASTPPFTPEPQPSALSP